MKKASYYSMGLSWTYVLKINARKTVFMYLFSSTASCKDDLSLLQKPRASPPLYGCSIRKCLLRWSSLYFGTGLKHDILPCNPKDRLSPECMIPNHSAMKRRVTPTILSSGDEQLTEHEENPDVGQLANNPSWR